MKILQIIAHPAETSFTKSLAAKFVEGAEAAGHDVLSINVFDDGMLKNGIESYQSLIERCDYINFAWPCMWEMPPARLVDVLQTVFVRGFAFEAVDGKMKPKLNKPVSCLISMGQDKELSTTNLSEAMHYCGLHPQFVIFKNVGPRLTEDMADIYMNLAYRTGFEAQGH